MCGILFQYDATGCDKRRFDAARELMAHRGPDAAGSEFLDDGRVALGHRRLSIIDLSAAANQPMRSGDVWIVFNGEIYNSPELRETLRARGHSFRTHSDTEVLLEGYKEWGGEELCSKLHGMFAFVVWDAPRRCAFLARDHVGQKPLYYFRGPNRFAAASEIAPALHVLGAGLPARRESVPELLYYGYIPEPFTFRRELFALLPGHCMTVRFGEAGSDAVSRAYWAYTPDPEPRPVTEAAALELVGREIEQAVKSHLLADVEVGSFLSGGVDSSCVAATAARLLSRKLKTFCIGMGDDDVNEAPRARATAAELGAEHHEEFVPDDQFRVESHRTLELFGQPFGDFSLVPTERVARLARRHVKCALTGDGGDEVFGGYAHYPDHVGFPAVDWSSLRAVARSARLRLRGIRRWRAAPNYGHVMVSPAEVNACLHPDFVRELGDFDVTWYFRQHWRPELDPFRRAQWLDIKTYLPSDILTKVDRCTMRHSLETRPPFLSHRLIEAVMNIPAEIKNPRGERKALFRRWAAGRIPEAVLSAPKIGFGLPPGRFPHDGGATPAAEALPRCVEQGIVRRDIVPDIMRLRYASWKMLQVEEALSSIPESRIPNPQ